jgi:hypothetical protein
MTTTTTYQTKQYQPKGGKPYGLTGYAKLSDLTTI